MKMSRLPASGLRQRKHASKKCTPCPAPPIDLFSRALAVSPGPYSVGRRAPPASERSRRLHARPLDDGDAEGKGSVRSADSGEIGSLPPRPQPLPLQIVRALFPAPVLPCAPASNAW